MNAKVYGVFESKTPEELAARYDAWAKSYESDLDDQGGPAEAADELTKRVAAEGSILDAGCGTGVVGSILAERGYRNLEGLDLSEGMLRVAGEKGCYRALHRGTLGEPLDLPSQHFDAMICVGVFVRAHAPSTSLHELVRVVKVGGYLVFTLRPEFYSGSDFPATMAELTAKGAWELVETTPPFSGRYKEFPEVNLQVWVYRRVQ